MATDIPPQRDNPERIGVEAVYFFAGQALIPPGGTKPPPRPPGKERQPADLEAVPGWECVELEGSAVTPPPGTQAPPRPPGKERVAAPPAQDPAQVAVLISRIETALQTIYAALAEIKLIQSTAG